MPSETFHLQRDHMDYLDELCNEHDDLNNPSQALKAVLDGAMGDGE